MKKLLALLLALVMTFFLMAFLTGCDSEEPDDPKETEETEDAGLCGQWKGTVDMADSFREGIADTAGEEILDYWKVEEFPVTVTFEFTEDGDYTMTVDEDSLAETLMGMIPQLAEGMEQALEDKGKDIEAVEAEMGMSVKKFLEQRIPDMLSGLSDTGREGTYELDGTKLYLDGAEDYIKIKLTDKVLVFLSSSGEDADEFKEIYGNTTFKRQ